jgi:hypothetical protein
MKKNPTDFKQNDLFSSLLSELDSKDTALFSKDYQEQQEVIDKPVDYVSRKAIELRPLDFLRFFPEFQNLSAEELKQIKILDANRTLETYLKRETDSLTLIIETTLDKLKETTFHIEVQTSYDDTIDERILVYNVLIKHKTQKPKVKTLLINLDPDPKCQLLGKKNFGTITIEYDVKNLWEQSYEEVKQQKLTGLLPFTPYLKGGGKAEIREASEILIEEIKKPQEQAEMLFLLALLAGRKYNTAGFQLLSPITMMNIESLRDDPTAHQLIQMLFPNELAAAKAEGETEGRAAGEAAGIQEGIKRATEDFVRRFGNVLNEEQIQQLKDKVSQN